MAAPIQSPAKCEVRSVIRFLNANVNVQRKFTNKLLLFMVTQRFPPVSSPKEISRWEKVQRRWWCARRSRDVVQRTGGRLPWLEDTEAGFKA